MAVGGTTQILNTSPSGSLGHPPFWYSVCGLLVRSDLPLPLPLAPSDEQLEPAWLIRRVDLDERSPIPAAAALEVARNGQTAEDAPHVLAVHRDSSGSWWYFDAGTFHVTPDSRLIEFSPAQGADDRELGFIILGKITAFVLYQWGYPALHGSAIITDAGAIGFLGGSGLGKSTMAAAFLRRGATLLADDVLPLQAFDDGIHGAPSLPIMKLWGSAAEGSLGLRPGDLPNLTSSLEKKLLRLEGQPTFARRSARIQAMYLLDRYDPSVTGETEVVIHPIAARERLQVILAQIQCGPFLTPTEATRFLPLFARLAAQAEVRILRYPSGFEYQETVCEQIMRDAAS